MISDACLPVAAFRLLGSTLAMQADPPETRYLPDYLGSGAVSDEEWVPQLAKEGGWIVLTADRGRRAPRLNILLPWYRVSGFFLVGASVDASNFEKLRMFLSVWPDILHAAKTKPGERFKVLLRNGRPTLEHWPLPQKFYLPGTPPPGYLLRVK